MLGYAPYLLTLEPDSPAFLHEAFQAMEISVSYSISIENGKPFRITLPYRKPEKDLALSEDELRPYVESERFAGLFRMMGESGLSRKEMIYQFSKCISALMNNAYFSDDSDHLEFCGELSRLITLAERIDDTAEAIDALFAAYKRSVTPTGDDRLLLMDILAFLRVNIHRNLIPRRYCRSVFRIQVQAVQADAQGTERFGQALLHEAKNGGSAEAASVSEKDRRCCRGAGLFGPALFQPGVPAVRRQVAQNVP